jgi:hypothetical protein
MKAIGDQPMAVDGQLLINCAHFFIVFFLLTATLPSFTPHPSDASFSLHWGHLGCGSAVHSL